MHIPLTSVAALAQFNIDSEGREHVRDLLLNVQDWQEWIDQVEIHGLSGFSNKHVTELHLPVPEALNAPLKALKMRHVAAAKARHKALQEIDAVFKRENLPYVALKGAALAPHLYGDAYLRPMRDMDLLVPRADLNRSGELLREIGYSMPDAQPSRFMRDMHQLPNATKTIDGFICSVELHHDGISREVPGHLYYPSNAAHMQTIEWDGLTFSALDDVRMLHQVARHLEGLHPSATLKLINVMDVIGLALKVLEAGRFDQLRSEFPHVINTLRCLHLLTPLPPQLLAELAPMPIKIVAGVGQIMGSLRNALNVKRPMSERLTLLFRPSDWWLHLYYGVDPDRSLFMVKWVRHPLRVANWLSRRIFSALLGG
ncbi:nucleotidyltransferase family protein [Arenicella xantha]|uniref:Putative nucleotidyltransferase-like protein n=1 Tax=Arenicella xantha TaxID=644221 RepID=A0A395JPG8_9GAMM|nr:nucleotidyltransferase family protein [Arenicella xantha]RBP53499.1 putative nucleotidyltransferase-like protein [Arenicella xantha]